MRSFLAANSTQDHFLIARMLSFFVIFATKVPFLTFRDKMWQFLVQEMDRGGGNKKKMRKCGSESLSISTFSLHFLFLFSLYFHFFTAVIPGCRNLCNPDLHIENGLVVFSFVIIIIFISPKVRLRKTKMFGLSLFQRHLRHFGKQISF